MPQENGKRNHLGSYVLLGRKHDDSLLSEQAPRLSHLKAPLSRTSLSTVLHDASEVDIGEGVLLDSHGSRSLPLSGTGLKAKQCFGFEQDFVFLAI